MSNEPIRLQKYLSQAWICSRRKAEEYIQEGLIIVNGKKAEIGQSIIPDMDTVEFNEKFIQAQNEYVYYKFYKPRWIETTCAQRWGKSIIDIIKTSQRVFPVGRLDKESDGLILLTNDGRITNFLIHPRYQHEKEYIVETFWPVSDEWLKRMSQWVFILWSYTKKCKVERISSWKFSITLTEWRNRQIRRMVEKVWGTVKKLKRVRIENIVLWNLKPWELQELSQSEKQELFKKIDLK